MVKIRQLLAFDAVVRLGSFAEAAKALHVTPGGLSLAIKELEERVGFRLLDRTTRSLHLTEAGRGYLPYVQRVLKELEAANRYASEVQQGHSVVRLATTQTVIVTLLAPALAHVRSRWPEIRVQALDIAAAGVADALVSRQADLAIGVRLPNDDRFECWPFFTSHWWVFLSPQLRLARKKQIRWADLADTPLIMNRSSNLHLQAQLGGAVKLANVQDTTTAASGMAFASTGSGAAVFPAYARPLAKVSGLRSAPILDPLLPHVLEIGFARQPSTPAPVEEVARVLTEAVRADRIRPPRAD